MRYGRGAHRSGESLRDVYEGVGRGERQRGFDFEEEEFEFEAEVVDFDERGFESTRKASFRGEGGFPSS